MITPNKMGTFDLGKILLQAILFGIFMDFLLLYGIYVYLCAGDLVLIPIVIPMIKF